MSRWQGESEYQRSQSPVPPPTPTANQPAEPIDSRWLGGNRQSVIARLVIVAVLFSAAQISFKQDGDHDSTPESNPQTDGRDIAARLELGPAVHFLSTTESPGNRDDNKTASEFNDRVAQQAVINESSLEEIDMSSSSGGESTEFVTSKTVDAEEVVDNSAVEHDAESSLNEAAKSNLQRQFTKPCDGTCNMPRTFGTVIQWQKAAKAAARLAKQQDKLVFLIQVSGNFAREEFT